MTSRFRVGLLFGGRSAEHEVSLQSANNVLHALDRTKYAPVLIGIDKEGFWHLLREEGFLRNANDPKKICLNLPAASITPPSPSSPAASVARVFQALPGKLDVVFPVLHGPLGEDGTIQGLLKVFDIPFVGAGVIGSAVGMDKDVMKRLLREAGLPIADFMVFVASQKAEIDFAAIARRLNLPVFVKPANLGSSVGIHKVVDEPGFREAVDDAFRYDNKIIIEAFVDGRELEISILGNENPMASLPGEIIPAHEFYSYAAKYIDDHGAALKIPADLPAETISKIQALALASFRALACEGMARVDFFLRRDGQLLINEINTIPGFTRISMYPKLWEVSGIGYNALIDRLLQLALERSSREQALLTNMAD